MKSIIIGFAMCLGLTTAIAGQAELVSPGVADSVTTETKLVKYSCPMHPSIQSEKPGVCPTCKMDLVKKAAAAKTEQRSVSYVCPMHNEVKSPTPGTCPKCGMTLLKQKTGK